MKKFLFPILILLIFVLPSRVLAANEVNIYFFHNNNCDICNQEKIYLEALKERYPNIRIYSYEVSSSTNYDLMQESKTMFGVTQSGVPFTIIGDSAFSGFSQSKKGIFQRRVYEYSLKAYENKLGKNLGIDYRKDLDIEIKEYKDNEDYTIEEVSGIVHPPIKSTSGYDKYKVSFYLITVGIILALILWIIHILDRRKGW